MVLNIDNNFEESISSRKIAIVDFWAPWCGPCQIFSNTFQEVSNEENINFYKLNVDNNRNIAKKYGVMSIPTIILFKDGKEIKRNTGILNYEELKKFIKD